MEVPNLFTFLMLTKVNIFSGVSGISAQLVLNSDINCTECDYGPLAPNAEGNTHCCASCDYTSGSFELPCADLPPLPPKPTDEEFALLMKKRLEEKALQVPQVREYHPPPVTCHTAFETDNADTTIDSIISFVESCDNTTWSRDEYSVVANFGDIHMVFTTVIRDGKYVTMCRRLYGDGFKYNDIFSSLLKTITCKPTVCQSSVGMKLKQRMYACL